MQERVEKSLSSAEDMIYIATAVVLIVAAITLLAFSVFNFFEGFNGHIGQQISQLLDGLLLVLMLVEILHTVGIFLKKRKLVIEPFLAVGIIAAIRRVLIITAEQVHPTPEHAAAFRMTMLELGLLAAMILSFVFCIFLLRRHGRDEPVEMEE
ncbi:phosphate-starvation-inducible PsiE family protein [Desulfuromonas acetoxidans]|uniref:phosphate-starvation-inducible PsiE family protein n=1 Tax=Desulfuromonas acetoxidans TaxID=891 RepID=UPI00292FF8A2|nr:phosphate-starvation-inducible PsiE family protein [Desulfuromonas acetoxidans]